MQNRKQKQDDKVLSPKQVVWRHTWTMYGLSLITGMRAKLRFKWSIDESLDYGGIELNVWHRPRRTAFQRWWEYAPDYTIGLTDEGSWYVYALYEGYDGSSGPYTEDVHLGEFPGFETAFFAMLTSMANDVLSNIHEIRYERKMDRVHKQIERDGLLDPL